MVLEVWWDSLWTLSFGFSQFHGHNSWLVCEAALRARDQCTSSTPIGGKGGAGPSSLHTTLRDQQSKWMQDGCILGLPLDTYLGSILRWPSDTLLRHAQNQLLLHLVLSTDMGFRPELMTRDQYCIFGKDSCAKTSNCSLQLMYRIAYIYITQYTICVGTENNVGNCHP